MRALVYTVLPKRAEEGGDEPERWKRDRVRRRAYRWSKLYIEAKSMTGDKERNEGKRNF